MLSKIEKDIQLYIIFEKRKISIRWCAGMVVCGCVRLKKVWAETMWDPTRYGPLLFFIGLYIIASRC